MPSLPHPPSTPPRVLLALDRAGETEALNDALRAQGYEAVRAPTCAALAALDQSAFDLLLTDETEPPAGGLPLHQAALARDPDLAVVLATAEQTAALEAMKTGAVDYVVEPLERGAVLAALSRALGIRRLRRENALLERRLREQAIELESARRELEAFSYSVSHDLRAPLRGVDGFARILLEDYGAEMPPPAHRLLDKIGVNTARMSQLIEELLRLVQLGRQTLSRQTIDMKALVRSLLDDLVAAQPDRRIDVHIADLAPCTGDPALLRQALSNVLANAVKFTRRAPTASIEVDSRPEDGGVLYTVRDNGAGFDMRYAHRMFGVFQRFHKESDFEGAGVGLAAARHIILRHGGRITAEAEVDRGATFSIWLPP